MSIVAYTCALEEIQAPPAPAETGQSHRLHSQIADACGGLRRLADIQLGIWLTRLKMAALRIVLCATFCLLSAVLAFLALVFLYAALYRILTDLLLVPTPWALLIFAGVHFLLAGILVAAVVIIIKSRDDQGAMAGGKA